jgi:hypothetical protein
LGRDEIVVSDSLPKDPAWYKQYMAKNLFYFKFWAINSYGTDLIENQTVYFLTPKGFDIRGREIAYCEYAIKINPPEFRKGWEEYLEQLKNQRMIRVSEEQFLRLN